MKTAISNGRCPQAPVAEYTKEKGEGRWSESRSSVADKSNQSCSSWPGRSELHEVSISKEQLAIMLHLFAIKKSSQLHTAISSASLEPSVMNRVTLARRTSSRGIRGWNTSIRGLRANKSVFL